MNPEPRLLWKRSRRARRPSLRIDPVEGAVVITLPARAGKSAGLALLQQNRSWVREKLDALPAHTPFAPGETVFLDGAPRVIRQVTGGRGAVWLEPGALCVGGDPEFLPRRVRDFLIAEAKRRFGAATLDKARGEGLAPSRISIRDTRSRWGSCTASRALMFSWRLVMAPERVQDYVIAHEVAHLRHMDHGPEFWALCETLSPHRREATAWLVTNGARLFRTG